MNASQKSDRVDIYAQITDQIVADLERGVRPWMRPWERGNPATSRPLRHTSEPYRGVNVLTLWAAAEIRGFASPYWFTFKQADELGAFVRKGERGTRAIYTSTFTVTETNDEDEEIEREIPYLKQYTVFNAEQCRGLPLHFLFDQCNGSSGPIPLATAQSFFRNTRADTREGGDRAYYAIEADYIQMPPIGAFRDAQAHAATLAHELTHWTGHSSRLNRQFHRGRWGDEVYAAEELVAEVGSAFLCADLRITPEVREDHASYIEIWLKVLKSDKRAIVAAASQATKAVDYLHAFQPSSSPNSEQVSRPVRKIPG